MNDKKAAREGGGKEKTMGNIIVLPESRTSVVWFIDITEERECCGCEYREKGMTRICPEPHWSVVVEAPTVDRLCVLLKKAEMELKESMAIMRTSGNWRKGARSEVL